MLGDRILDRHYQKHYASDEHHPGHRDQDGGKNTLSHALFECNRNAQDRMLESNA